jgi:hypothetical protein
MRRDPSLGEYALPMTAPLEVDPAELEALAGVLVELGTDVAASGNTPDAVSATEPSIVAALAVSGGAKNVVAESASRMTHYGIAIAGAAGAYAAVDAAGGAAISATMPPGR